jgi:CRISPR-associated protein Cas1
LIKRTIEISREPLGVHLSVRDGQLLILKKSEPPRPLPACPANLAGAIPCEDLGVLMVDQRETTYSHAALAALAESGAAVVVCGRDHHPVGMYLPLSTNTELLARLDAQLSASKPTLKRLWASIVAAKVRAQADALPDGEGTAACRRKLLALACSVRSGDPDNVEAQAAAIYWPVLFGRSTFVEHPFRRRGGETGAPPPNNLLDYGYAALRAAVARALVSAGLLPALGIKHRGRSNPFCLADDLMEPLRPLVDRRARLLAERGEVRLVQTVKADLLRVLTDEVGCGGGRGVRGPLLVAVVRYVASVVRVLAGEQKEADIPEWSAQPALSSTGAVRCAGTDDDDGED